LDERVYRVVAHFGRDYTILDFPADRPAVPSGNLRRRAQDDPLAAPAVGDWVACSAPESDGPAVIRRVLDRRSAFMRKAAGTRTAVQVVAANIDIAFLVAGADGDFNLRRLERYLIQARDGGATPVALLNKADLVAEAVVAERCRAIAGLAPDLAVYPVSARTGNGLDALAPLLNPDRTLALLGSSGVGKSTLANALLGEALQLTGAVREDDSRGRHTTTGRRLLRLPGGAYLLDTPGMRELALWSDGETVLDVFADVRELAAACRFRNCRHDREPDCAVNRAVSDRNLDAKRVRSFQKLAAEAGRLKGGL
jgi:ribosome biogenesis GTPase